MCCAVKMTSFFSEEFEPLPEEYLEATETRVAPAGPEPEPSEPPEPPEPGTEPESSEQREERRYSARSQSREPSSDLGTDSETEPEPLFVTPQLPPAFVLNEVDTAQFVADEPGRLRVCDEQFKVRLRPGRRGEGGRETSHTSLD